MAKCFARPLKEGVTYTPLTDTETMVGCYVKCEKAGQKGCALTALYLAPTVSYKEPSRRQHATDAAIANAQELIDTEISPYCLGEQLAAEARARRGA